MRKYIQKYYAIKMGNNVKDIIVDSWDECKKYVFGYPSIFKSFKNKKEAEKYLKSMTPTQVKELIWQEIYKRKRLREKLQRKFEFEIVEYVLDAMIDKEEYNTICLLINMTFLNNKISEKNANILKEYVKTL